MLVVPPHPTRATSASARRHETEVLIDTATPFKELMVREGLPAGQSEIMDTASKATRVTRLRLPVPF
jgi:hypothetical protein